MNAKKQVRKAIMAEFVRQMERRGLSLTEEQKSLLLSGNLPLSSEIEALRREIQEVNGLYPPKMMEYLNDERR